MFFYNLIGFVFLIAAAMITLMLSSEGASLDDELRMAAVLLALMDLAYRFLRVRPMLEKSDAGLSSHWLTSGEGGSLMFLPAWVFAIVAPLLISFLV